MIGNEEDAAFIRDWYAEYMGGGEWSIPEGWTYLGSGCYRAVYASPSGVAYKVEQAYGRGWQTNEGEAKNLREFWLRKMPEGCRLPLFQHFELDGRGVLAMELFEKTLSRFSSYEFPGKTYWDRRNSLYRALPGIDDLHGGNLAVDEKNDKLVPIDLGG